jgi:hypothetical protein
LVQYHTSIVKLGVAITSVPHLCIVLCKTHFNSLARDARLLSYPANFAADSSMPSSSSPPS